MQSTPQHSLFNPQSGMQALRRQPRDWAFAALVGLGVLAALAGYAAEYDQQWTQVAQRGDTALMLHTTASFGENLRSTATTQAQETEKLQAHSQKLLQQALNDARRVEALQKYMARQQAMRRAMAEKRDQKQLEDDLNARRARS